MRAEQRGQPQTIAELVGHLDQRRVNRRLHELGDEGIALVLEAAAIREDDPGAELAARDLRKHILNGGAARSFLAEFPQHQEVDFSRLNLDASLKDIAAASSLLPSKSLITIEPKELTFGMGTEQVVEVPMPEASPESQEQLSILFEKYPLVKTLFGDENSWVEDGQNKFIERRRIEELFAKRDQEEEMSATHKSWLMTSLWKEWKQRSPEQTGGPIKGRGVSIFLSQEEAVNFLWFVHTRTADEESSFRNYSITTAEISTPEVSKKK